MNDPAPDEHRILVDAIHDSATVIHKGQRMNERIRLLAEQADEFADDKTQMPGEYHPDWHDIRDQKFAELIVQECMEWCDAHATINGTAQQVRDSIKQHFGFNK